MRLRLAFPIDSPGEEAPVHRKILKALTRFYRTGRPSAGLEPTRNGRLPAQLLPVLDLSAVRTTYPAFLTDDEKHPVRTLTEIVDTLIESVEGEGDDPERLKRDVLKIERTIRQTVVDDSRSTLGSLWDGASDMLFGGANGQADRMNQRRNAVADLTPRLDASAILLTCSESSVERLFGAIHARTRTAGCEALRAETDVLRVRLLQILEVDDSHAPEKLDSRHLAASVGAGDIDAEVLSGLLSNVPLDTRMPEARRRRIEDTLKTLTALGPRIMGERTNGHAVADLPARDVARTVDEARTLLARNARELVDFFRAFHTARLEVDNRYQEDEHDHLLEQYSLADLTADERHAWSPVFLVPEFGPDDGPDSERDPSAALLDLLAGDAPVRILRWRRRFSTSSDVLPVPSGADPSGTAPSGASPSGAAPVIVNGISDRLAFAALSVGTAFVMQTAASDLEGLTTGLSRGLAFAGPALFDIYTGSVDLTPELPAYLRSAVALDARAVPSFRYDPSAGDDLASRFTVDGNPDVEADWPSSRLPLENGDDINRSQREEADRPEGGLARLQEAAFTAVDFLACDGRFDAHFVQIPRDIRQETLTTVSDAIDDPDGIPYVLLAGSDERVHRYAVTRFLVEAAASVRDGWRTLREMGGVRNSHVLLRLDEELARIEAEKRSEIDEITARHDRELDRATEAVAETVVSNLATRLLGLTSTRPMPEPAGTPDSAGTHPSGPDSTPPADPAVFSPSGSEKAQDSDPDSEAPGAETSGDDPSGGGDSSTAVEDAPLIAEEAYIDSPLCTSCNECTNLNGQIFAYDENKQAYIKDASAGPFRDIVVAAEICPVRIIHPGKPLDPEEPDLDDLVRRAEAFN